ncbi:MAG TPA: protein-methionine-sulfoxide reductase heme-binding subunit MsrQ [Stellaceae bacterium]|nr:protein-methionine-sulfoxide reductase heme-binding subunit MsrQ [Stellaceae bacterium]
MAPVQQTGSLRQWLQSARPRLIWLAVFLICLGPLASLIWRFETDQLAADPVEDIIRTTGDWAIRFLVAGLLITPLRRLFGWHGLARFRRMIGLYAFFYVALHLTTYLVVDQGLDGQAILHDILKRPYITVGMATVTLLIPLAATSTDAMTRWLGGQRWRALHRLVYLAALLGVVHYYLLVKLNITWPVIYGAILLAGLAWRVREAATKPKPKRRPVRPTAPAG